MKKHRIFLMSAAILCLTLLASMFPRGIVYAFPSSSLVNGSFETGDYTGWTLWEDSDYPDVPDSYNSGTWGIASSGMTIDFGDYTWDFYDEIMAQQYSEGLPITYTAPDGSYLAYQLQSGPGNHRMYQDVTFNPGATTLYWEMSYNNWAGEFDPEDQSLAVYIRDLSDNILETLFITTQGVDSGSIPLTTFSRDISAYAGTTVRLDIELRGHDYYFDAVFDNFGESKSSDQIFPLTVNTVSGPGKSIEVMKYVTAPETPFLESPDEAVLNMYLYEYYSCPYIFTWDGSDYQKENDIYSVARGKGNEFTDYLYLQNQVEAKDGAYSFEIREIPGERSHTDLLKLMIIDHPAGVDVGIDSSGKAHSYRNVFAPDSAVDKSGADISSFVSTRDMLAVDMYHEDTLLLDFSSVDISAGAKLILRVDGFEGPAGGEPTRKVPAILIQTQQSGEWVTREQFIPKELAAEGVFDVKEFLTESKMIRLSCMSCLPEKYHRLDYIALDNTEDVVTQSILAPETALLNGTTPVLNETSSSDDVYALMEEGDILTITFPITPPEGETRNFVLVSEGYYEIVGQTYYVYTWDGSSWVERATIPFSEDEDESKWAEIDLLAYLPDPDGEYKVKVENIIEGEWEWVEAGIDQAYMVVNDYSYAPSYAKESDTIDILHDIAYQDYYEWDALNKWAIIKFEPHESTEVWGVVVSDPGLTVTLDPEVNYNVPGGTQAVFTETITVANDNNLIGQTLNATVTFYANHYPEQGAVLGTEEIHIYVAQADLAIEKTDNPDPVIAGTRMAYAVTVTNNGPDVTSFTVTETLPSGVYLESVNASGASIYKVDTDEWSGFDLANGESITLDLEMYVESTTPAGMIDNAVTVSGNAYDPDDTNNNVTEQTEVITSADLTIAKTEDYDPVMVGADLTYTIVVSNNGPSEATGIIVTDILPSDVVFKTADTHGKGIYNADTGIWSGFDLDRGHNATLTLLVRVQTVRFLDTVITNTAMVTSSTNDPDPTNNTVSQSTNVTGTKSVGGELDQVNKLTLMIPCLAMVIFMTTTGVVLRLKRRKED